MVAKYCEEQKKKARELDEEIELKRLSEHLICSIHAVRLLGVGLGNQTASFSAFLLRSHSCVRKYNKITSPLLTVFFSLLQGPTRLRQCLGCLCGFSALLLKRPSLLVDEFRIVI